MFYDLIQGLRPPNLFYNIRCRESILAKPTSTLSGRPSSRRLSFSRLVIMLTVSSISGLALLSLSSCSSAPASAASLWPVLVLHVSADGLKSPGPRRPPSPERLSFSSEKDRSSESSMKHILWHYWKHLLWYTILYKCLFERLVGKLFIGTLYHDILMIYLFYWFLGHCFWNTMT